MKVLVVGSGGREHALVWALAASSMVDEVICAPGNAGIECIARVFPVSPSDLAGLVALARAQAVDLVVVGPELPLVLGLVDRLEEAGIPAFGPTAAAARLEGSKAFAKDFCARHGIPTAPSRTFELDGAAAARAYIEAQPLPVVVKVDGLAAGKGVVVAESRDQALGAVAASFRGAFGQAGQRVVVEAFLEGEEASLFALCDGTTAIEIGTARDHKRAFDGDLGPNTGGMGAVSPASSLDTVVRDRVMAQIVRPTLAGMAAEGCPFKGILYVGLMIGPDGPKLVEFNVRFGDPECQAVVPRLRTDLASLLVGALDGMLARMDLRWHEEHALTVVLASRGYPGSFDRGTQIRGLGRVERMKDVLLFHGATRRSGESWVADGGRALSVTGLGATLADARARAYAAVNAIDWPEGFCRSDIGSRAPRRGA